MYKNQLQELAQRSCFNLPAYSCIREGPDHAPRFKATVNFSGETFESPTFCSTLRQAEHAAAEVALSTLANRGPSKALAARVLDETGVYKNLLQETAHKAGLNLPVYTTVRSGPGHVPVFSCTVKLAGMSFTGNPARTKKQAQKNAALAAWSTLKRLSQHGSTVSTSSSSPFLESKCNDEQEQVVIARFLSSLQQSESKHFMQIDRQHGHQRFIPMCRGLTPPSSSLYPEQCQSWAYPSFSPELALCQVWQQEQLLQLQSHLLTLPVSPTPQLGPQILPYMQSIFHPSHPLCIPTRKQPLPVEGPRLTVATSSSSLCFSSKSVPEPIRSRSTVTIQEIKEEKTEKSSKFPPSVVPDASVSVSTNAESRIEQPIQEDANKNIVDLESKTSVKLESKFRNVQYGGSQSELASHRNLDSGFRLDNLCIQNPQSASNLRQQYHPRASSHRSSRPPSSAAAHTSMRTVGPISSVRPHPQNLASQMPAPPRMRTRVSSCSSVPSTERMNLRQVHPNFMAPAVRIRTVVPVCSAPPPRQMPSSIQEATVVNREKKDAVQEDASTAASELDNLHL